jgi:hypothetical protein
MVKNPLEKSTASIFWIEVKMEAVFLRNAGNHTQNYMAILFRRQCSKYYNYSYLSAYKIS